MLKPLQFTLFFLLTSLAVFSQETALIRGVVVDQNGLPLDLVNVVVEGERLGTSTNRDGLFELSVPANRKITVIFSEITHERYTQELELALGATEIIKVKMASKIEKIEDIVIEDRSERVQPSTFELEVIETAVNVGGGLEASLTYQALGVQKSNELSSSYSVRGGNFDENLVYVNDFEIYRPFLIRSGQQEGLSFANPDLVKGLKFSSGGFQAEYGDKLSSVLDVTYKKPKAFGGSVSFSLLGATAHLEGTASNKRLAYLIGFRNRSSRYILNSLNTEGEYNPSFLDFQTFWTYRISKNLELELIANYARNRFRFEPVSQQTTFGVVNQVLQLNLFFDGQEFDTYDSFMSGLGLNQKINDNFQLKWLASFYQTAEKEAFDIQGDYFIGEVETDFSNEDFGEIVFARGVGTLHDWARNVLNTRIVYGGHKGLLLKGDHQIRWGADYKREFIEDKLNEWELVDSAGYSLPYSNSDALITDVLKTEIELNSNRISGYLQDTWSFGDTGKVTMTYGARFQYWDVNKEFIVTPRVQFSYKPMLLRDFVFTAAAGLYYQPPFYRELRNLDGEVNLGLRSQKSAHFVAGLDYNFKAWNRDFKFVTEVYYKYLWDVVPYEIDNVLIRYFGENRAVGYSTGIDFRLHGELVEGADSWISMSVMSTREDIEGDSFWKYFNANGDEVSPGLVAPEDIVDSNQVFPGYIPRPTDQRVNFALFFQDYIPKNDNFKVHLNLLFGTGLPFGPPDNERFRDQLRIPSYRRVDIGFSALLYGKERRKEQNKKYFKNLKSIWASLEVYNLLGISNTVSYLWVKDFTNTTYAVPNFLTSRRINGRVIVKF